VWRAPYGNFYTNVPWCLNWYSRVREVDREWSPAHRQIQLTSISKGNFFHGFSIGHSVNIVDRSKSPVAKRDRGGRSFGRPLPPDGQQFPINPEWPDYSIGKWEDVQWAR
jgi:hypothetical protein